MLDQTDFFTSRNVRDLIGKLVDNQACSIRQICAACKFRSPNYLALILSGQRGLSPKSGQALADFFKLKDSRREYFFLLAKLERTRGSAQQLATLQELQELATKTLRELSDNESIHDHWLYPVIWEMAQIPGVRLGPELADSFLKGVASREEIVETLKFLTKHGLLDEKSDGTWQQLPLSIKTINDRKHFAIRQTHIRFFEMAKHRLNDPLEDREYQGLTLAMPKKCLKEFKKDLRFFFKEMNRKYSDRQDSDQIFRIQACVFSVTRN